MVAVSYRFVLLLLTVVPAAGFLWRERRHGKRRRVILAGALAYLGGFAILFDYSFELARRTERTSLLVGLCLLALAVGLLWRTD